MSEQAPEENDATADDHLVEASDNSPTDEDGPQDDVDQDPIGEDDVIDDDPEDGTDG